MFVKLDKETGNAVSWDCVKICQSHIFDIGQLSMFEAHGRGPHTGTT